MCKEFKKDNADPEFVTWQPLAIDDFGRIARGDAYKKLPALKTPEVHILLPGVQIEYLSGGPNTAFLLGAELARLGYNINISSLQTKASPYDLFFKYITERLNIAPDLAARFKLSDFYSGLEFHENDRVIATASWTVPTAMDLCSSGAYPVPAYLIQDLEPLFLPFGIGHGYHMANYGVDYLPVINSQSLADMLFAIGAASFADHAFRNKALIFQPAIDRRFFHFSPKMNSKKVLGVYTRFHNRQSRNMTNLALEVISQAIKIGNLSPEGWEVYCFGAQNHSAIRFSNGLQTRMLSWLDFDDYAANVRACDAGIALMCSPHTGYMPLELAACGAETVTNTYLFKNRAYLRGLSPFIHPAEANVEELTRALLEAISAAEARRENNAPLLPDADCLRLPGGWREAFAPIMPALERWIRAWKP